jgi:hypothetical protein
MANMRSLSRLHRALQQARAQIEFPNFGNLEIDVSAEPSMLALQERSLASMPRRRFALRRGPEAPRFDDAAIIASVGGSGPRDRGGDLRAMAAQDRIRALLARQAPRGGDDHEYCGRVAIQI